MNSDPITEAEALLRSGKLYPLHKSALRSALESAAASGCVAALRERVEKTKAIIEAQDRRNVEALEQESKEVAALASQYATVEKLSREISRISKERSKYTSGKGRGVSFGGTVDPAGFMTKRIELLTAAKEMIENKSEA